MLIAYWLVLTFLIGVVVGSFLNVCVARLPYEKSLLWPGSRCGNCLQPIRWYDNVPIASYLWLWGRCRTCGAAYSIRYLLIELLAGLGFVGLFYVEVVRNVHRWPDQGQAWQVAQGIYPIEWWLAWGFHALLFSFLMTAAACDLSGGERRREIPVSLTLVGTLIGLIGAVLFPWPWPSTPAQALPKPRPMAPPGFEWIDGEIGLGVFPWPVCGPLPDWLEPGTWQLGLATGIAGALAGSFFLRAMAFLSSKGLGKEALGLGDADLMMMAGSFLGWQPVIVAFFLGPLFALVLTVGKAVIVFCQPTIKVRIGLENGKPVYHVDGERVAEKNLADALDRAATKTGKRAVYIYGPGITDEAVSAVEEAAANTTVRRVLTLGLMPFGPSLACGVMLACLGWRWIGAYVQALFFWGTLVLWLGVLMLGLMFVLTFLLRLLRR